jgi:autophagy-related protein 9
MRHAMAFLCRTARTNVQSSSAGAVVQEGAMNEIVAHTHWVPSYWRGKAHTSEVRSEFSGLYQYQVVLYLEEVLSVVLLPWICILLSQSSHEIISFLHKVRISATLLAFDSSKTRKM